MLAKQHVIKHLSDPASLEKLLQLCFQFFHLEKQCHTRDFTPEINFQVFLKELRKIQKLKVIIENWKVSFPLFYIFKVIFNHKKAEQTFRHIRQLTFRQLTFNKNKNYKNGTQAFAVLSFRPANSSCYNNLNLLDVFSLRESDKTLPANILILVSQYYLFSMPISFS